MRNLDGAADRVAIVFRQAEQSPRHALWHPLGRELAHALERISHVSRDLLQHIGPELRVASRQVVNHGARPAKNARRLHGDGRHGIRRVIEKDDAGIGIAGADEARNDLASVRCDLRELQMADDDQIEGGGRLTFDSERLACREVLRERRSENLPLRLRGETGKDPRACHFHDAQSSRCQSYRMTEDGGM